MKKVTHNDRVRFGMDASMYYAMGLLEWDMMTYCMFKYECGLMYLEAYLGGDKGAIDLMQRSGSFWGWWKLHWFHREQTCFNSIWHADDNSVEGGVEGGSAGGSAGLPMTGGMVHRRRMIFKIANNPVDLARCLTPSGVVMEDSYSRDLVPLLK